MGRTIEIRASGEKITFLNAPQNVKVDHLELRLYLPADGGGPPMHMHPLQTEYFEVESGTLCVTCDGKEVILTEGQSFTVPPGASHRCFAKNGKEVITKAVFTPALNIEYTLTQIFEVSNRKGAKAPSPFDATFVLAQSPGEYYLTEVPLWVQKKVFPLIGKLGRLLKITTAKSLEEFYASKGPRRN